MNFILILLLTGLTFARSIVPDRVVTPSLDLFSRYNKVLSDGSIEVRVTTYSKKGEFVQNGSSIVLSQDTYESYLAPSLAVLEMIPDQRNNGEEKKHRRGTAFSIGHNLVITNNHVLDESFKNTTECADFELKDSNNNTFDCKKVHYCNPQHDICLIEMNTLTKTKRDGCVFCRGTKYTVAIAEGPSLKLKQKYSPAPESWQNIITTAIGNSSGFGIHYSQGRGFSLSKDRIYFYAPITKGNSGGPLLNDEGHVIGVVKLQSKTLIHTDPDQAYNIAAPSELVIRLIRDALRDDPETLEKFNLSVVQ